MNRIDTCTNSIPEIFPLCISVLSNIISIVILLFIAGRLSGVLLLLAALAVGVSFLAARYESSRQERHENEKQKCLDKTGGLLEQTVSHIAFSRMYERTNRSWKAYTEERENVWKIMWKQERISMYIGTLMETLTSVLRGFPIVLHFFWQTSQMPVSLRHRGVR